MMRAELIAHGSFEQRDVGVVRRFHSRGGIGAVQLAGGSPGPGARDA